MDSKNRFHPAANIFPMMSPDEIETLAADIKANGLREPIVLDKKDGLIIDGRNRWLACRKAEIRPEFEIWDGVGSVVDFVISLNLMRRHLDETQKAVAAARAKPLFEAEARARQGARTDITAKLQEGDKGEAAEKVAEVFGTSARSVYSAEAVLDSGSDGVAAAMTAGDITVSFAAKLAKAEPAEQAAVLEKIESGMKPTEAARQYRAESIAKAEAVFPSGKYRVIYADPPWSYSNRMPEGTTEPADHYPTDDLGKICALPVKDLALDDAVLFLWATSPLVPESMRVIDAWGFAYKTSFVWDKVKHNMGHYNSVRHEFLWICTRGSCQPDVRKLFDSVVVEERTEHSRKPEVFRKMIETLYPHGKKIELFSRGAHPGWDVWGFEAQNVAS